MKIAQKNNPVFSVVLLGMVLGNSIRVFEGVYLGHLLLTSLFVYCVYRGLIPRNNIKHPISFILMVNIQLMLIVVSLYMGAEMNNLKQISQLMLLFVGFFVGYSLCCIRESNIELILESLLFGLLFNAVAGLFQSIFWILEHGFVLVSGNEWFRVQGITVSPSDYVSQLIIGFFLLVSLPNLKYRKYYIVIVLTLLLFSMSRSSLVILFLISGLFFWRLTMLKKVIALFVTTILTLSLFALNLENFLLLERVLDIVNYDFNIKRIMVYQDVLEKTFVSIRTTFFGSGYGSYAFFNPSDNSWYPNTHSVYFHYLYSGGLIGLMLFLILIIFAFSIFSKIKYNTDIRYADKKYIQPIWLKYMLASILIVALVENNLLGIGTGWLVSFLIGISYFICNKKRDRYQ